MTKQIRAARTALPPHSLHLAWQSGEDSKPMLLCTGCGSYTSGTQCKLGEGCIPRRNPRALSYIRKGRHPTTKRPLEGWCILDDAKAAQLANVAISTLKGETLLKQYTRLPFAESRSTDLDVEAMLATILDEEGFMAVDV